jgi:immune inhibitor A
LRRLSAAVTAALTTSAIAATLLSGHAYAAPKPTPAPQSPDAPAEALVGPEGKEAPEGPLAPQERTRQALRTKALEQLNKGSLARTSAGTAPKKVKIGNEYVQLAQERRTRSS